ncbi:Ulp1 protease family, carboxy-terminal domain protein [Medicago truncatula]|uniref:Ulp1 protease family, carboxy-terminal domain protein n=1 Tax=Medicago truncatula TaxID=3880 RepID=A0A072UAL0_MEDTR|nr:Ulp1 protease family, carboxy-terminal domain protein [Medicago truncatula]
MEETLGQPSPKKTKTHKDSNPNSAHSCVGDNASKAMQVDIPQHAQVGQAEASPIAEEDEGVETSVLTPDLEIISPNHMVVDSSDHQGEGLEEGSDMGVDLDADQFIVTPREDPIAENPPLTHYNAEPSQHDPTSIPTNLSQLEESNPLDAFDLLASDILMSRSTGKSSNVSTGDLSQTSTENLFAEFRSKVLRVDLFEIIEQDENAFLEIQQGCLQRKDGKSKLEEQTSRYDQLLDEIAAFKSKLEAFRQETPLIQSQVADIDLSIAQYKAKIEQLEGQKAQLLAKEGMKVLKVFRAARNAQVSKNKFNNISWVRVQCPRQENGIDCGYFVMRFMKEILISKLNEIPKLVVESERISEMNNDLPAFL